MVVLILLYQSKPGSKDEILKKQANKIHHKHIDTEIS